ncbi:FMN-binding negative transcriptional regulator [Bacillus sp. JJ1122]|uniref:FMN-binding negative transcriptional regulator n=1 Tax=Bacillus sp. JJ1122 TaxID=3122951 RepID=UPI003000D659
MYIPKHFIIDDETIIFDVIESFSFATLISQHGGEPYATHLPLILNKEEKVLYGHFARTNEQWKDVRAQKILVIFQGPHSYISPSWYETNMAVPTWNYVAIHVYGELIIIEDKQFIFNTLDDMVEKYERPHSGYNLNSVEPSYIEGMNKGIVAFEIKISKIEAKAKLSQNHPVERQKLIIGQLENSPSENDQLTASLMKKNLDKLS